VAFPRFPGRIVVGEESLAWTEAEGMVGDKGRGLGVAVVWVWPPGLEDIGWWRERRSVRAYVVEVVDSEVKDD